jgi:Tfp pilus assembly protein PilO
MKSAFDLLEDKERKILLILSILVGVAALLLVVIFLPQRRSYHQAISSLDKIETSYQQFSKKRQEKKQELDRWHKARQDMVDLEKNYFYNEEQGLRQLRLDLEQHLSGAGIYVPQISYDYSEFKAEKIRKVTVGFNLKGSYLSLKRFIHSVEAFPKFLVLEKIDFLNIDPSLGVLELRIVLAGYYEV